MFTQIKTKLPSFTIPAHSFENELVHEKKKAKDSSHSPAEHKHDRASILTVSRVSIVY